MNLEKTEVVKFLPPGKQGVAEIAHFEIDTQMSDLTKLRAAITGRHDLYVPVGKYARLMVGGTLMMTDTKMEWDTNRQFLRFANGDVLVGGLGIGMILLPVLQRPEVKSVTVVEKYRDVIDLVEPHLRAKLTKQQDKKLKIVHADVLEWKPPKGETWDVIYFDIWPSISPDNVPGMMKLKRRFAKKLRRENDRAWMGCWREADCRTMGRWR